MNNLARTLLLIGALVLALLIGVLIGRGQRSVAPVEGNAQAVQITTAPPPMAAAPPPPPLPAPPPAPKPAAIPKIAPDVQVQEDAAAVGMTTKEGADQSGGAPPAPNSAAGGDNSGDDIQPPH
ncbi:MAG: hypothetical protein JWQ97_461 [Phenylobacterium sp.]|nr:hypothetical protein [Phenylobacterium sp.]